MHARDFETLTKILKVLKRKTIALEVLHEVKIEKTLLDLKKMNLTGKLTPE